MGKKLFNIVIGSLLILTLLEVNVRSVSATQPTSNNEAVISTGMILPVGPAKTATLGSSLVHKSGFAKKFKKDPTQVVTNANTVDSSLDFVYSGEVIAPISGTITVPADCPATGNYKRHQIVYIQGTNGFAVGLAHMILNSEFSPGKQVAQGTVIGKTVWPIPTTSTTSLGCGWGTAAHIHFTLMKWTANGIGSHGANYTEQSIVNTYLGKWIVKPTYLDGPRNDVQKGGKIEDIVKFTSPHPFSLATGLKIIEGRSTGIVQTMFFVTGNIKQTWNQIPAGDGYFWIKNRQYNNCLSIENASLDNGAKTLLSECLVVNADHQKFMYVSVPDVTGKIVIQAKHSGKVLDIPVDWGGDPYSGNGDGLQLQQWDVNYGTNQQWSITKP